MWSLMSQSGGEINIKKPGGERQVLLLLLLNQDWNINTRVD